MNEIARKSADVMRTSEQDIHTINFKMTHDHFTQGGSEDLMGPDINVRDPAFSTVENDVA